MRATLLGGYRGAINRAEAAATVVRTLGWTTSDGKTDFADDASIAAWAKP